jgi:dihydroorotase
MKRRSFVKSALLGLPAVPVANRLLGAEAGTDLLITGGRVIDPASGIDAMVDVAVRDGIITSVGRDLFPNALQIVDVGGRLVVPGLIDVHVHARDAELPPAANFSDGVTTLVDAGSRGAGNIDSIIRIGEAAPNRLRILLNIGMYGNNPGGRSEFLDGIATGDVGMARAAIHEHRDWIVGVKARLSRGVSAERDLQVLKRAILASEPFGIPVMIHIGDTSTPLPQLLSQLRPGDIVTHMYAPTPNGILDDNGRLLPEVRAARRRGIRFDFGNGLNEHWDWTVAEAAMAQDFPPDTISSDLNVPGRNAQVFNLPNVLSKFMVLGMSPGEVIACATQNAAATFSEFSDLGTLKPGAIADIAILDLAEGEFDFVDNYGGHRTGSRKLSPSRVYFGGIAAL